MADVRLWLSALLLALCPTQISCLNPDFFNNQTTVRRGNVNIIFINNTPFRASFSFGSYDALDNTPGQAALEQLRVEAGATTDPTQLPCRRNVAVGTQDFINRVIATKGNQGTDFNPDAFNAVVNFSSAPLTGDGVDLPDAGTANGLNLLLGVQYSCEDVIFVTFNQDPDAPGGFRADVTQIPDTITQ